MSLKHLKPFPSCHVHIHSFDSASTPEAFAKRELELGTGYLTVTDHGSLGACRTVYELAKANSLKPILGLEAYVRDDSCSILKNAGIQRNNEGTYADYNKYYHLSLAFQDQPAYEAGVRLLSLADLRAEKHGSERKPLFDWTDLEELAGYNVTMTSSCLIGMVSRHLVQGENPEIALKYFDKLRSINKPGNFYVELFPHVCDKVWKNGVSITDSTGESKIYWNSKRFITNVGEIIAEDLAKEFPKKLNKHTHILAIKERHKFIDLPEPIEMKSVERIEDFLGNSCSTYAPNGDVQLGANQFVYDLAKKYNLPMLIGDDAHFATPNEKVIQDIRLMTQSGGNWKFANSYHRFSSQEAYNYFNQQMGFSEYEFEKLVDGTHQWASKFDNFTFKNEISLPTKFYLEPGESSIEHTMQLIKSHGRFKENDPVYKKRLLKEIKLLAYNNVKDLLPYFYTPEEICRVYNTNGLLTGPGRGCFLGESEVLTENKISKRIDSLTEGELVYSHDKRLHPIETIWKYFVQEQICQLVLSDGKIVRCTSNHEFYTTLGWVEASKLIPVDESGFIYSILLPAIGDGVFYVQSKRMIAYSGWVYDLKVKDSHSYNVYGIAVHNSSAGLLLNYCLGITHVDPIRYDLSMERFLTEDRISSGKLPDVDSDLQSRDFLTETVNNQPGWLKKRFGDHFAQISTEIALKLRSSVKDVARIRYGKIPLEIENLTKKFEIAPMGINDLDFINGYKGPDGLWVQGSKDRDPALQTYIKKYPEDWGLVQKLIGLQRSASKHASAFVFANKPIHDFIPMTSVGDTRVTQYTASSVELSGGLKLDLLVLQSLVDINEALKLIRASTNPIPDEIIIDGLKVPRVRVLPHAGSDYDIWDLPEDQYVFDMIANGDTETVFQFCTSGAIKWLKYFNQIKPDGKKLIDSIESMATFTALDRPGPLDAYVEDEIGNKHNMLVEYARRAMGEESVGNIKSFDEIIPEYQGIAYYQESVQKIYYQLTGCSKTEAEEFRSDLAKKKKSKIDKAYPFFMERVSAKIGKEEAEKAWNA